MLGKNIPRNGMPTIAPSFIASCRNFHVTWLSAFLVRSEYIKEFFIFAPDMFGFYKNKQLPVTDLMCS